MGGHQHFGEFLTLEDAVSEWGRCLSVYGDLYHLHLMYGLISYDAQDKKYKLVMRFAK